MTSSTERPEPKTATSTSVSKGVLLVGLITYGMGHTLLFVIFGPVAIKIGLTELQVGFILSISGFSVAITSPWWGRKTDVWGRKNVFVWGLLGYAFGSFVFGLCLDAGLAGWFGVMVLFPLLMAARAAFGLISSGIHPAATAFIADTTDSRSRSQGMALIGMAAGLGTIIGPAIGGLLARFGLVIPLYVAAAAALIGAVLGMVYLTEPERHVDMQSSVKLKLTDKRILPFLILIFTTFLIFVSLQVITAFYLESKFGYSEEALAEVASMAIFAMAIVIVFTQAIVLQAIKVSPRTLVRSGLPFFATGMLVIGLANSIIIVFIGYALLGLSFALTNPGINAAATLSVEPEEYGAVAGLLAAAPTAGIIFGPLIGATLYGIAPNMPMLFGAGVIAVLAVYAFLIDVPNPSTD